MPCVVLLSLLCIIQFLSHFLLLLFVYIPAESILKVGGGVGGGQEEDKSPKKKKQEAQDNEELCNDGPWVDPPKTKVEWESP